MLFECIWYSGGCEGQNVLPILSWWVIVATPLFMELLQIANKCVCHCVLMYMLYIFSIKGRRNSLYESELSPSNAIIRSNLLFIKNPSQYSFNTWTPRYIIIIIPIIQLKTSNKIKTSVDAKLNFVWILICVTSCRLMGLTLLFSFSVTAPIRVGCKCQRWK